MKSRFWKMGGLAAGASACLLAWSFAGRPGWAADVDTTGTMSAPGLESTSAAAAPMIRARSSPSDLRNLAFSDVGIVKQMLVNPGDHVKAGQLLASLDSDQEELELKSMKIEADSNAEVDKADTDSELKKKIFVRTDSVYKSGGATNAEERDQAELDYNEAVIVQKYAREERDKRQADVAKQANKVEKLKLISPMDGVVEKVSIREGEIADPNKPDAAITIVQNQPLWVNVPVPSIQATQLKLGQTLSVAYQNDPDKWFDGKIIYLDPVVDAASDRQTVRLELGNAEDKPAGLWLVVKVPMPK